MKELMLGNAAIARGAYEAGVKVAAAYPGTPSTEILENITRYPEIHAEWAPNEKVALEVAVGASIGGARALAAMKHVGVNVAADPLFTFAYTGVNGGLVLITADDPGMHSSQNEQDNRYFGRFAKIPVVEPSDSQEALGFILEAFEISERFDTPVLFRVTTRLAHAQSLVETGERLEQEVKPYIKDVAKYVMMPAMARQRHLKVEERMKALSSFVENTPLNRIEWGSKAVGVITSGIPYQYVREALGTDVSILKLGVVYPLPWNMIRKFAAEVDRLYVVEELEPFLEEQMRASGVNVTGKELFPKVGELGPEIIRDKIAGKPYSVADLEAAPPVRPPVMCPGCPHRGIYYILSKLKLTVTGDIGCYTLGALAPLSSIDSCICMGASIGTAHGLEKARGAEFARKTVAVIGDSTFVHSGITGLVNVVYNRGTSTVMILDNSTTAMTGHQDHPATGKTIGREPTHRLDLEALIRATGVERVSVVDPFDLEKVEEVVRAEIEANEPSVIIARRPCALLVRQPAAGQMVVDPALCSGCKRCGKLGCPGISFDRDLARINNSLCNSCGLCAQVCRVHHAIQKVGE